MPDFDCFLKLDGIEGEATDSKHKNEIKVESFSWGVTQTGTLTSKPGRANMGDFVFSMHTNKASSKILSAAATGEHFQKAVFVCRKAGKEQQEFLTITLSDVMVSSYQLAGGGSDLVPAENVALCFGKVEFEYKAQKPDGSMDAANKTGFDLKTNKKI